MFEHHAYRKLAAFNRLIADARDRVEQQKERVLIQADQAMRPRGGAAEGATAHFARIDPPSRRAD